MPGGKKSKKPHRDISGTPSDDGGSTTVYSRRGVPLRNTRCMDCGAKTEGGSVKCTVCEARAKRRSERKYEIGVEPVQPISDTPNEGGSSRCAHSHLDRSNRCLDCGTKIKRGALKNVTESIRGTPCTHSRRDTRNRCLDCDATLPPLAAWASEDETVTEEPDRVETQTHPGASTDMPGGSKSKKSLKIHGSIQDKGLAAPEIGASKTEDISGTPNEGGSSRCNHSYCDPDRCILENETDSDSESDDMMASAGSCIPQIHQGKWGNSEFVDMDGWSVCVDSDTIDQHEVSDESDEGEDVSKKKPSLTTMKIGKPSGIEMPPPDTEDDFILTFDGYHRKKGKNGGYGALLRTGNGVPIAAVAGGSQHWISPNYHALEGLLSGLNLAIAMDVDSLSCICNSYRLSEALLDCFVFNDEGCCRRHPNATFDVVCRICLKYFLSNDEPLDLMWDILRKIVKRGEDFYHTCGFMDCSGKEWNKPADFLAKLVRDPGEERKLTPKEFPEDFWNLLVFNAPA